MARRSAPPAYRALTKVLHWSAFALLIAAMVAGQTPVTRWGLTVVVLVWAAGFAVYGVLARPGPALSGVLRTTFVPLHIAILALFGITTVLILRADPGPLTGPARQMCLAMIGIGSLHGIFHLWRHTALGDGALRNMTPKILHSFL